jgi:predicted dehydrogenase
MKFAVLNPDADSLALVRSLSTDGENRLVFAHGGSPGAVEQVRRTVPGVRVVDSWEEGLVDSEQTVIVGRDGSPDLRFEQLRKLAQEGIPTIVVHPFSLQPLEYHELDMNLQATAAVAVVYEPSRAHPAVDRLTAWARGAGDDSSAETSGTSAAAFGRFEQVVVQRRLRDRRRSTILEHFIRDVGLLRRVVGEFRQVSALGTLPVDKADGMLGVQLTTAEGLLVRWSVSPAQVSSAGGGEGATLSIAGEHGGATVEMPVDGDWSVNFRRGDETETETFDRQDASDHAAAQAADAVEGRDPASWRAALSDMELCEAVERSLARGRTIELYHEAASEHGTFKGLMAAGGCLLLLVSISIPIVATIVGRFRFPLADIWPYALAGVLIVFLALQSLKFVFPPKD